MISNYCVSELRKKQPTKATSSCGGEYRAALNAKVECVWFRKLLSDLSLEEPPHTCIFTDSQSALAIARNPIFHACIIIMCERDNLGLCTNSSKCCRDFYKTLSREKFEYFFKELDKSSNTWRVTTFKFTPFTSVGFVKLNVYPMKALV